jgi:hypothetical protein
MCKKCSVLGDSCDRFENCRTEGDNQPKCEVKSYINDAILLVNYDTRLHCKKAMSYGMRYFCLCNGRRNYYKKHKK